ncbi:MAG: hypothetical protein WAU01_09060 [Saprospiraceae bacterium]
MDANKLSLVMMGASGAVGTQTLKSLVLSDQIGKLTLLGRTEIPDINENFVHQHKIDIHNPDTYSSFLTGHAVTICTLGVGEPSKMTKEEFVKIDKIAVFNFARECKNSGIKHFELLASVGIDSKSSSFYLRTKGELVDELKTLNFDRLSIFKPSMILTPTNRYGMSQAIALRVWPWLSPVLIGRLRKYRGIDVDILGRAMALNIFNSKPGYEVLQWDDFYKITDG